MKLTSAERILVTGGAGFMGSAFIRFGLKEIASCQALINLDLLTYAGNCKNVKEVEQDPRYLFVQGDICDEKLIEQLCREGKIDTIVHFAAETHVDRSISVPKTFLETNVRGTALLLEVVRKLPHIHLHQISTDEVFGALPETGLFTELSPYRPNSPYSASKAAADHFVRSYAHTFGLSVTLSHSSNNYGPFQHAEKFIPRMITHCLEKKRLPIYGTGAQVRDWLFVEDHAEAVWKILQRGKRGETYNIGGSCELSNLELLQRIIAEVAKQTGADLAELQALTMFVADRPGHDFRYALDTTKIQSAIGWAPRNAIDQGLVETVRWYIAQKEMVVC